MKILLIDVNYDFSSTGKIVKDLKNYFDKKNHNVEIIFGRGKSTSNETGVSKGSFDIETYIHAGLTRLTGFTGMFSPFSTRSFIRIIDDFKPDIVHLHELHGYFINIYEVVNYIKKMNIPIVWTFHCEFMYTGKCGYAYDCNKWKNGCGSCPSLSEYPSSWFDKTSTMHLQKKNFFRELNDLVIVTPSTWLLNRVRESFLSDKKSTVIYNGIDTSLTFYPKISVPSKLSNINLNKPTILAVAPNILEERKGGEWVLNLAERFDNSFNFILVGVNDLNRKYASNVFCFARTSDQSELAEFYSIADLFLICSKRENFPTTCLEALSCGTPVIGFDEGGTRETAPAPYGRFVEYGNLEQLEVVIRNHFENIDVLADSDSCRKFAVSRYSKELMAENYLKIYSDILEKK